MTAPIIGIFTSFFCIVTLTLLFRYERKRGSRILGRFRGYLDLLTDRASGLADALFGFIGRDLFRQTAHYFFHTLLTSALLLLNRIQKNVERMLRSNRILARRARSERTKRNKLDEIADHRAAIALSEEEKRKHKEKMLNG